MRQNSLDPLAPHSASPQELRELVAMDKTGAPYLAFRDENGSLQLRALTADGRGRTIGRRPEVDLPIPWDGEVSGVHAELECVGGDWLIVDDGLSRNGTYVNGERLSGRRRLCDDDRIRLGGTLLAFKAAHVPAQAPGSFETTVANVEQPLISELSAKQREILIALCRPYRDDRSFAKPATNRQIGAEVFLGLDAVRTHLRILYHKFGLGDLAQGEKRVSLAERAFQLGLVSQRDLGEMTTPPSPTPPSDGSQPLPSSPA